MLYLVSKNLEILMTEKPQSTTDAVVQNQSYDNIG